MACGKTETANQHTARTIMRTIDAQGPRRGTDQRSLVSDESQTNSPIKRSAALKIDPGTNANERPARYSSSATS